SVRPSRPPLRRSASMMPPTPTPTPRRNCRPSIGQDMAGARAPPGAGYSAPAPSSVVCSIGVPCVPRVDRSVTGLRPECGRTYTPPPRPAGHHGAASPPLPPGRPAMSSRPSPAPSSGDRLPPRTRALRTAAIVLLVIALAVAIAALRGAFGGGGSRAGAIVDTMQGGGEALHAGFRRAHARGL